MLSGACGPRLIGAIALIALVAPAAPAAAREAESEGARAAARRPKPKPVSCRPGQVTVVVRKRTRCARPARRSADERIAYARAVLGANGGVLRARGRRIGPIWKAAGGRVARVRAKLLRALPKALAWADRQVAARASARVPGDPPSCAGAGPASRHTSVDGFSVGIGAGGDLSMSVSASAGYRIEVLLGGVLECADLDLPQCPMPSGRLEGTDGRRRELGMRITNNGALVQSLRTTMSTRQTLKGQVSDDAKLDHMDIADTATETLSFAIPGRAVSVRTTLRGSARLNMRSGAITGARVQASVGFSGTTAADALTASGRTTDEYAQRFPDLVRAEGEHLRRRERLWLNPNRCAKLVLDPADGSRPVQRQIPGTLSARIEANAGGVAERARWEVRAPEKGTFTPTAPREPAPSFTYTASGNDGERLKATFFATSTAGVAELPWSQPIEDTRYFKLDNVSYDDQLSLTGTPPIGSCTQSTSQTNTSDFAPSGHPFDGAIGREGAGAAMRGGLTTPPFTIHTTAAFSGCRLSDEAKWESCSFGSTGIEQYAMVFDVELGPTSATVSFHGRPVRIGDVDPVFTTCVPASATPGVLPQVTGQVASTTFALPGVHTLSFDAPGGYPVQGGGTLTTSARYELSFHRVNVDGSPYTG